MSGLRQPQLLRLHHQGPAVTASLLPRLLRHKHGTYVTVVMLSIVNVVRVASLSDFLQVRCMYSNLHIDLTIIVTSSPSIAARTRHVLRTSLLLVRCRLYNTLQTRNL